MLTDISYLLTSDNSLLIHGIIFVSLILGGFGLPIPEDIPVLLAGVVASKGVVSLPAIAITCYTGVILADLLIYGLGYKLGPGVVSYGASSPFIPALTPERVEKIRLKLCKRQFLCIFLARHLFPLRSATFLCAGALRVPFLQFLISDLIAAFVSIVIMLAIGYAVGESITPDSLKELGQNIHYYVILSTAFLILLLIWRHVRRKYKKDVKTNSN